MRSIPQEIAKSAVSLSSCVVIPPMRMSWPLSPESLSAPRPPIRRSCPFPPRIRIIAEAAEEDVGAGLTGQEIFSRATAQNVRASASVGGNRFHLRRRECHLRSLPLGGRSQVRRRIPRARDPKTAR